jgi:hypothetical protein
MQGRVGSVRIPFASFGAVRKEAGNSGYELLLNPLREHGILPPPCSYCGSAISGHIERGQGMRYLVAFIVPPTSVEQIGKRQQVAL